VLAGAAAAKEKEQRECACHQPRCRALGRGTSADGAPAAVAGGRRGASIKDAGGSPCTSARARLAYHARVAGCGRRAGAVIAGSLNVVGCSALAGSLDAVGRGACGANRSYLAGSWGDHVSRSRSCEKEGGKNEGTRNEFSHRSGDKQFRDQVRVCPPDRRKARSWPRFIRILRVGWRFCRNRCVWQAEAR
jgi:hypothetical protein